MVTDCSYFFVSGKEIVLDFFFLLFIEYLQFSGLLSGYYRIVLVVKCVIIIKKSSVGGGLVESIFFYSLVKAGFLHSCKVLHF